jgi:hypothetical protein
MPAINGSQRSTFMQVQATGKIVSSSVFRGDSGT